MKKYFKVISIAVFGFIIFQTPNYASMGSKLKRGVLNALSAPAEIPKHMINTTTHTSPDYLGPIYGVFYGFPKGVGYGLVRLASGAIDTLSFPVSIPSGWGALIPLEPFTFDESRQSILER